MFEAKLNDLFVCRADASSSLPIVHYATIVDIAIPVNGAAFKLCGTVECGVILTVLQISIKVYLIIAAAVLTNSARGIAIYYHCIVTIGYSQ